MMVNESGSPGEDVADADLEFVSSITPVILPLTGQKELHMPSNILYMEYGAANLGGSVVVFL
jgi:hypothetical protein